MESRTDRGPPIWEGLPVYLIVILYVVLPNLPPLISASVVGSGAPHGLINLEFLVIGALSMLLPHWPLGLFFLMFFELAADYAYGICFTYKFTLDELMMSVRYLAAMPAGRILEASVVGLFGVLLCAFLAVIGPRPGRRVQAAGALLLSISIAVLLDSVTGYNLLVKKDVTLSTIRLARLPFTTLAIWQVEASRQQNKEKHEVDAKMDSASAGILSEVDSRPPNTAAPNVVLILVESWGLELHPELANALTAPFSDPAIAGRYQVVSGTAPFSGLTIPGEARELCQSTLGFGILNLTPAERKHCLPALLHDRGYQTLAIHGYLGQMFYRSMWYPKIGFDRTWFETRLAAAGLPVCKGAFPGICDASIADWIGNSLLSYDQGSPKFVYWVTLNSHLPVPFHPDLPADDVCQARPALEKSRALCSWFRLEKVVLESIERIAVGKTARPTIFVIVGDHAPPFSGAREKEQFSSTSVPYLMLVPKSH